MNLQEARSLLKLPQVYDLELLKKQYRQQAKICHPDVNPDNPLAHQAFLDLSEAFALLEKYLEVKSNLTGETSSKVGVKVQRSASPSPPDLSPEEEMIKKRELQRINQLLAQRQIARCLMIIDALVQRIPQDDTLKTRKAWLYYDYAKFLISDYRIEQARKYLKAATKLAPSDSSLWSRINELYNQIERSRS